MNDHEDVQRLIRLKRYETPGEPYFDRFLEDFKERQRSEMLRHSSRSLLAERVGMWFSESSPPRWAVPTGLAAAAAVSAGLFIASAMVGENEVSTSHIAETPEVPAALPDFPASEDGVIRLQLPKPENARPPAAHTPFGNTLPASASGSLREL